MAHETQKNIHQILTFARLIKLNIMQKRPLNALAKPPNTPSPAN
tara:strand:- start:186 stop:317 length:132 start_codon:yes stop_codon:yes gene_type:complete